MDINAEQLPTGDQLRRLIEAKWPRVVTCWSQATDEIRDMSLAARQGAGLDDSWAIEFWAIESPSEWNSKGTDAIIGYYQMMSIQKRIDFITRFGDWLY